MMPENALAVIPPGLRDPLINEYASIVQNYLERRWSPSELSGGRFCEIVYSIIDGHARGVYGSAPNKPRDFVGACRALESQSHVPRSFQLLIPRALPPLYEIRNNRGVGHVGGDVDPNFMDATFVLSVCSWIMSELIRVFHNLTTTEAQTIVDRLVELKTPLVWVGEDVKRILDPTMPLKNQVLILLASSATPVNTDELLGWIDYHNRSYFRSLLKSMSKERLIELSKDGNVCGNIAAGQPEGR